ncbi:thiosulfate dehydrogenase [Marinobacter daqiaonensis]|uniref:Thiosulfate dehydrogenase n=1 Tax=Marinobacter daqiaonensis TaxID=650891 RepID=A0A1I6JQF3_9GAMM|nr:c-type cytochrome [Marinobacter daqiaonensis]SFR81158.1 thiosulfate dehydrogenase [Marinobacter daqiaonensis]
MKLTFSRSVIAGSAFFAALVFAGDQTDDYLTTLTELGYPAPADNQLVHIPPTLKDLEQSSMHPELKRVIRRGHDLFTDTQQLRGENVFNNMNCSSCHLGDGRMPFSAPVWPAAVTLPNYRGKNDHVNSLEERIAGCFTYSMNGKPPDYGSDNMLALAAYHHWLARGVTMYPEQPIYGRGFPAPERPEEVSYQRGEQLYKEKCAICHGDNGEGLRIRDTTVFPAPWGNNSYNWGAGMVRVSSAAGFVKNNMPLGQPLSLTDQEAWDVAHFMNSQERPQDPRYTGDVAETLEKYGPTFHKHSLYGQKRESDGKVLGDHSNTGNKDFLKPDTVRPRTFE